MRQAKQPAILRACRRCGKESRGKYAYENHICREEDVRTYSREQAMEAQRKGLL